MLRICASPIDRIRGPPTTSRTLRNATILIISCKDCRRFLNDSTEIITLRPKLDLAKNGVRRVYETLAKDPAKKARMDADGGVAAPASALDRSANPNYIRASWNGLRPYPDQVRARGIYAERSPARALTRNAHPSHNLPL